MLDETDRPATVHALLTGQARQRHDDEVLRFQGQGITWAELNDRVARGAAAVRAAGLTPGARVAVDFNHPSCLEITLACAPVGTVNVAVNFRLTAAEIEYVINNARAEMLFVGPELTTRTFGRELPRSAAQATIAPIPHQHPPAGRLAPTTPGLKNRQLRCDRLGGLIHEYLQIA